MPYYVDGGTRGGTREHPIEHGSAEDVARLATFEDAARALASGRYTGMGFATLAQFGVVAFDIDDVVRDGVVLPAALAAVDGTYAEISPSGTGLRAFYRGSFPGNHKALHPEGADFKLEVFSSKGFVTVTGNVLDDCKLWGYDELVADITPAARALYEKHFGTSNLPAVVGDGGADWMLTITPPVGLSHDQIREALAALPDDMEYDDWLRTGMAIHHETDGSDEGRELWLEKSRQSPKFTTDRYLNDRWRSFGRNTSANPTTFRFVLAQPSVKALRIGAVRSVDSSLDFKCHPKTGAIMPTLPNLRIALGAVEFSGFRIAFDEFVGGIMICLADTDTWRPITDANVVWMREHLENNGFSPISRELMRDAVLRAAELNKFDSARDWLSGLAWDETPRIDSFLTRYFGAADTPYHRAISRCMWTQMAARVFTPGCKADMVPIAVGKQGTRKSSAIAAMSPIPDAFAEWDLGARDDDAGRLMLGKLILELGELRGLRRRDHDYLKAFITRTHENWVPKFREHATQFERRCVFVGSTNSDSSCPTTQETDAGCRSIPENAIPMR
ncbi:hypothetical protein AWV79_28200 [Cupriavidus sp. UYMMa02A]|nr:hypothetical protein AWV79_28200 [Cupriavidus sp. UYMMa02A]